MCSHREHVSHPSAGVAPVNSDLNLPPITTGGLLTGLAVVVGGIVLAVLVRIVVRPLLRWRGRSESASVVFSRLLQWVVVLLTFVSAVTAVFPSVKPVNALGGLGIVSIAAGIAFQTVLGNMFAGIVLLGRDGFRVGDQISVTDVAGTVTAISLTNTAVRTFDGRQVLIPNSLVHGTC